MFTRWLVRDRRTNDDRLAHLSKMNVELDRRRIRRPLSMEEFGYLLEAAYTGPDVQHIAGPDRAVLYIVGAYTGYRRNEIGSVTPRSFDFDSDPPTLTVQAGYSKRRRTDILPLRQDFAERIRDWIATKPDLASDEPLFKVADKRTAEMIVKDLDRARAQWIGEGVDAEDRARREKSSFLAYQDEHGHYVDFHALRKTFITNLTRTGAAPKTAQILARHSDINLTMNTYMMLGVMDQVAAVEALSAVPESKPRLRATGT
jgi:integrase